MAKTGPNGVVTVTAIWWPRPRTSPACFVPGKNASGGTNIDLKTTRNVRWVARLGSETYSSPAVAGGKLFIGTNDFNLDDPRFHSTRRRPGAGAWMRPAARLLWRLVVPKLESKQKSSQFDEMDLGVCSTPTVEGNRVYVVPTAPTRSFAAWNVNSPGRRRRHHLAVRHHPTTQGLAARRRQLLGADPGRPALRGHGQRRGRREVPFARWPPA